MRPAAAPTIRLADYAPYPFEIENVSLVFTLAPQATRVRSRIRFRPRVRGADLRLDGEGLRLIHAAIDGREIAAVPDATGLTLPAAMLPEGAFTFEAEVEISPQENTALEGLYMSNGMYCTQCEAEGFRKITFYPDRPDVMAPFDVRIEADFAELLSNGNPTGRGPGWAEWHDPWPKPAYLFALVAGDLVSVDDRFTTASGREVSLRVLVRAGDEGRCDFAMDALKRSMRWDEREYGREYDLDVFHIVAVDDFNMGAMENKGLNIFNSRYVLASPETATDIDYARIEAIVAHEYFHNWTGNRITCRDWFQLCLKEGLTVFRDQQFTADERSRAVKRIEDVLALRGRQFREDAGPLAHAVRPESYVEINNFYTATVYEKGAEIIRMLRLLVGAEGYAKALDLYFTRHDGQACTIEDWLKVFEDATGRDLTQFARWYSQAGTPHLDFTEAFDNGRYTIEFSQLTPPTPGQGTKLPQVVPIALGLLDTSGREVMATRILEMTEARQAFSFDGFTEKPIPSILRDFSAPVKLEDRPDAERLAFLLAHDTDPFNRWEAGRRLARDVLAEMAAQGAAPGPAFLDALGAVARDGTLDPAFRAFALGLPTEDDIAQYLHEHGTIPDPLAIHAARRRVLVMLAEHLGDDLPRLIDEIAVPGPYSPAPRAAGCRALAGRALSLLARLDGGARAARQFAAADNMTDQLAALSALLDIGEGAEELAGFARRWQGDRLVMDKWYALQIVHAAPQAAVDCAHRLAGAPDFDWKNPNRFRAVFGALSMNHAGFHAADGAGYDLLADWLIRLDPVNPQTAARMCTAFETWSRYDAARREGARAALGRIAATPGLSRDVGEMVGRILGG